MTNAIQDRINRLALIAASPATFTAAEREQAWIEGSSVGLHLILVGLNEQALQVGELCGMIQREAVAA